MSARIVEAARGVLTIEISGQLAQPELAAVLKRAGVILQEQGKMGVLILAEGFQGWGAGGESWGDVSFQLDHDHFIDKLAIVAQKKWEDEMLVFVASGLRQFPVAYFEPAKLADARAWLAGSAGG